MNTTLKLAKRLFLVIALLFLMRDPLSAAPLTWTFELTPAPDLQGPVGTTVSWGYSITNEDPDFWLVLLNLDADVFQHGTPNAVFDFPILAPGQSVTGALYDLAWDLGAPIGFVNSGLFTATADFYSDDPFNGGFSLFLESQQDAPYSAEATGGLALVPEPASGLLILPALGWLVWRRRAKCPASRAA